MCKIHGQQIFLLAPLRTPMVAVVSASVVAASAAAAAAAMTDPLLSQVTASSRVVVHTGAIIVLRNFVYEAFVCEIPGVYMLHT